jgi:DNA-binding response OmpR family regulator
MFNILIIDDDIEIINKTTTFLKKAGFNIYSANNGEEGLKILKEVKIHLIVLDFLMPVMNGVELCNKIRVLEKLKKIPVIMLTELSELSDKFIAFEAGADDYLIKPFDNLELVLRIKSLLKKYKINITNTNEKVIEKNELLLNKKNSSITINNKEIYLTSSEFLIIYYLYKNIDKVVSSSELLENVMGYEKDKGNSAIIRAHIKNIRTKIEEDAATPKILVNIQGRGYTLNL